MTLIETQPRASKERKSQIFHRDHLDHYVEPLSVGASLFAALNLAPGTVVLDPCCGWGRIPRAAQAAKLHAIGSDILPRWEQSPDGEPKAFRADDGYLCLTPTLMEADWFDRLNWYPSQSETWRFPATIVSNPPYNRAEEFLGLALERAVSMVALILPLSWISGGKRSDMLAKTPLYKFMPICPRPSMPPGSAILAGQKVGGGTTDFATYVWLKGYRGAPQVEWLRSAKP